MPELAEVAYYVHRWDPGIGAKILDVSIHPGARVFRGTNAGTLAGSLRGKIYRAGISHGKNMLFSFSGGVFVSGHLGMTGHLKTESANYQPEKHDHLVLHSKPHCLVFSDPRMFGNLILHLGQSPPQWWIELPPCVLSDAFTKERVAAFLERRKRSPVKAILLDQSVFPGIGNWMADEILWRSGIHPDTKPARFSENDASVIWKTTRTVSRGAMKIIAPDWRAPPDSWLFNHRWEDGGRCPRCRAALARGTVGGRTTCWCPDCQPRESQ